MGGKLNIRIDQGATFRLRGRWRNPLLDAEGEPIYDEDGLVLKGSPIDLTGFIARMQIRRNIPDAEVKLELTSAAGEIILSAPTVLMTDYVRVATVSNVSLDSLVIDGVSLAVGDRVLAKNQTDLGENGIYVVGAPAWSVAEDALEENSGVWVWEGTVNSDTVWRQTEVLTNPGDDQIWEKIDDLGVFEIVATDEQTEALTESGVYDLELESAGGEVTRVLEGKMRLSKEVTRV